MSKTQTATHSHFLPAMKSRFNYLLFAAIGLVLFVATASAFAQEAIPALNPNSKPGLSSDWLRMKEGLKLARPMPDPQSFLRPSTVTPSGSLLRFDPRTKESFSVPSALLASESKGTGRDAGHKGMAPVSTEGKSSSSNAPGDNADVIPMSNGNPTQPRKATDPLSSQPWNGEYQLLLRFLVPNDFDQFYLCSASTASDFHLISAGHCVYNHDPLGDGSGKGAGFAAEIWAWPAQTDIIDPVYPNGWTDFPYGVAKMTLSTAYNAWINNSDLNWDISFITLDRRIGDHTGWAASEWGVKATSLAFAGYPAEPPFVPADNPFQYTGFDSDNVILYTCCRIEMDAFVYGGMSGGGVFRPDGGQWIFEGVNSTGNRMGYAEATLLTAQIHADLLNTIQTDKAQRPPVDQAQLIEFQWDDNSKDLLTTSAQPGGSFKFELNAFNAGYTPEASSLVDVYLTKSLVSDDVSSGIFCGTVDLGALGAFTHTVQVHTFNVPSNVKPDKYYVGWVMQGTSPDYNTDRKEAIFSKKQLAVVGLTKGGVQIDPNNVTGGSASTGELILTGPAPSGGVTISLSTNNSAVKVPFSVQIRVGASSANFPITTSAVTATTVATITARDVNSSQSGDIRLNPASPSALKLHRPPWWGARLQLRQFPSAAQRPRPDSRSVWRVQARAHMCPLPFISPPKQPGPLSP